MYPDGMNGEMCKAIWQAIPDYLMALFSRCVREGYFPNNWKQARVVILLKSPDKVRSNPRSYRGISLLPVLGKVLERIMVNRLEERAQNGMSERQYGFRKGKCVEDAWIYVKECVKSSTKRYVLGIFVDFKGAFDYLNWESIIRRLEQLGCPEINLWKSYFSNRKACVVGIMETVWKVVSQGAAQGSIAGPFVWNRMMDLLLAQLEGSCEFCAYADDLLILVCADSRAELERKGESLMTTVQQWGVNVGVSVSQEKTVTMLLKGKLSAGRPPIIKMGNVNLRYVTQVKYLGISMGERMTFDCHVSELRNKLTATVGQLRRVLRCEWGLSKRAVQIIYKGLFVACAAYGAAVWYDVVKTVRGRSKIISCQRVMLLACLSVCRTVSTDALQVLMGVPPLDLEVMQRGINFKIKRRLELCDSDWPMPENVRDLSAKERKILLRDCVMTRWQERWTESENGRVTFQYIKDVTFVEDHSYFEFNLALGFLLTGHGSMNDFLHRRCLSESAACACGAICENWEHVLCECPMYSDLRDLGRMGVESIDGGYDFSRVLGSEANFACAREFAAEAFKIRRRFWEVRRRD